MSRTVCATCCTGKESASHVAHISVVDAASADVWLQDRSSVWCTGCLSAVCYILPASREASDAEAALKSPSIRRPRFDSALLSQL